MKREVAGDSYNVDSIRMLIMRDVNRAIVEYINDKKIIKAFNINDEIRRVEVINELKQLYKNEIENDGSKDKLKFISKKNRNNFKIFLLENGFKGFDDIKKYVDKCMKGISNKEFELEEIKFKDIVTNCSRKYIESISEKEIKRHTVKAILENYKYEKFLNNLGIKIDINELVSSNISIDILEGKYNNNLKKQMKILPDSGNHDYIFSQFFKLYIEKAFYEVSLMYLKGELQREYIEAFENVIKHKESSSDEMYEKVREMLNHDNSIDKNFVNKKFLPALLHASICYNNNYNSDNIIFKRVKRNCYTYYKQRDEMGLDFAIGRIKKMASMALGIEEFEKQGRRELEGKVNKELLKKYYDKKNRVNILKNSKMYNGILNVLKLRYIKDKEQKSDIATASKWKARYKAMITFIIVLLVIIASSHYLYAAIIKLSVKHAIAEKIAIVAAKAKKAITVAKILLFGSATLGLVVRLSAVIHYAFYGNRKFVINELADQKFDLKGGLSVSEYSIWENANTRTVNTYNYKTANIRYLQRF